jgi:sulfate adenylyltransferase subunit 1
MTQEIIKFLTAGNVDDGKSTLIGRLLHDTNSLYQDQIDEVKKSTESSFEDNLDFSLFLDGLSSERAQKITIDVAYRYFSYQDKKFIIADAPGHEQYTRNMAVAASNSDLVIILIDATKGVKTQTIRHSFIANLFGIKNVIVAINKMDLVNFDHNIFDNIRKTYLEKIDDLTFDNLYFVPIAAKSGENIVKKSDKFSWYHGQTLVQYLLNVERQKHFEEALRFQVQNVVKHQDKRFYQGLLSGRSINLNDEIIAFPSKKTAKITKIIHSNEEVKEAKAGSSIAISFNENIDLERGGVVSLFDNQSYFADHFSSHLIWFSNQEFSQSEVKEFLIKINHNYLRAKISNINHVININDSSQNYGEYQEKIFLNQIASVNISLSQEVSFDLFKENKNSGSFLLIDKSSNETVACGIITNFLPKEDKVKNKQEEFLLELGQLIRKHFGDNKIDFNI